MNETLPGLTDASDELSSLSIIRTETALSRFPIHRMVKKGSVKIEIHNQSSAVLWEVTYNSKYGQPGPLAYKLDTWIVNRRIEEAGHPTPRLLRLGSLRDICRELGNSEGGVSTQAIRKALMQNASAFINAKITYKTTDRTERFLEAGFTRYSVLFTGETLPDGTTADAVYLLLNEPYWQVIDAALTRPLDYDYLRSLPPAAQRFYEIVSYQIYGALFYKNERARLRYSEYCMLSTATRYFTFDQVKKQMFKIHRHHLESGYLAKASYEQTTDDQGQPDWWMYYVPGPNASREYQQFTGNVRKMKGQAAASGSKKTPKYAPADAEASLFLPFSELGASPQETALVPAGKRSKAETASVTFSPSQNTAPEVGGETTPQPLDAVAPETAALIAQLVAADLNREVAERFAREKPDECRRQLLYLPFVTEFTSSRGAFLRRAIEQGFTPPKGYTQFLEESEAKQKKQAEANQRRAAEAARNAAEAAKAAKTADDMARLETEAPETFLVFEVYYAEQRLRAESQLPGMTASAKAKVLKYWDLTEKRQEEFRKWLALSSQHNSAVSPSSGSRAKASITTANESVKPSASGVTKSSPPADSPSAPEIQEDPAQIRALIEQALKPGSE